MSTHKVDLDRFEGPLDLLLHLIKKNDLDVHDIPIAFILDEYLVHLKEAEELNIDLAGEFILMAAELTYIKSKILLPPDPSEEEDEGPDPRLDLAQRLMIYEKFKKTAKWLSEREMLDKHVFAHPKETFTGAAEEDELVVDMTSLLASFHTVWSKQALKNPHEVHVDRLSVSERMLELVDRIKGQQDVDWLSFFEGEGKKEELVVTFLALLEMARLKMIRLTQTTAYSGITVHSQLMEA
jgi:segregation and condensation protein A